MLFFFLKYRFGVHLLFFFFYLFFRQFYWEWKRKPVGQGNGFFGYPGFCCFPFPFNPRLFKNLGLSFFSGLRPVFLPLGVLLFGFITGYYPTNDGPEKENNTYYIYIQSNTTLPVLRLRFSFLLYRILLPPVKTTLTSSLNLAK